MSKLHAKEDAAGRFSDIQASEPELSASPVVTYQQCALQYKLRYIDRLGLPSKLPPYRRILGSLIHAMEEAEETSASPRKAAEKVLKEEQKTSTYSSSLAPVWTRLLSEAERIHSSWGVWRSRYRSWKTIAVEKRIKVRMDGWILSSKPDWIIREGKTLAIVESKNTERDDKNWAHKWPLNLQTTMEAIATSREYKVPPQEVRVMIKQTVIHRQRLKSWTSPLPQPLTTIDRKEPRWVRKDPVTLMLTLEYLSNLAKEITSRKNWPAWGTATGACSLCEFRPCCKGEVSWTSLKPLPQKEEA